MTFERPIFLLLAALSPFFIIIIKRFFRSSLTVKLSLGMLGGEVFRPPLISRISAKLILFAEIIVVSLLLIVLAGPVRITESAVYKERGADIIFVLDISPSMAALDMNAAETGGKTLLKDGTTSRFEASRALILKLAEQEESAAIGLAALGNEAALLLPPTIDRAVLETRLAALKLGELGDGTALGEGITLAAYYLKNSAAKKRACVILTDGENNAGWVHPETAAAFLAAGGADFFVIGLGGQGNVPIDYTDPETGRRRQGTFDSRYDIDSLVRIARSGGGIFMEARTGSELQRAFLSIAQTTTMPVKTETIITKKTLSHRIMLVALFLLFLSFAGKYFQRRAPL